MRMDQHLNVHIVHKVKSYFICISFVSLKIFQYHDYNKDSYLRRIGRYISSKKRRKPHINALNVIHYIQEKVN